MQARVYPPYSPNVAPGKMERRHTCASNQGCIHILLCYQIIFPQLASNSSLYCLIKGYCLESIDTCVWPTLMWAKPNLNSLTHKRAWIKREQQSNLWLHRNISLLTEIYKLSKSKTPRARGNLVTNFAGNPGSTCGRKSSFNLWGNPVWGIAAAYQGTG